MPERLSRTNHPIQHSDKLVGKFNSFLIIASRVELIMNLAHFLLLPPSSSSYSASQPSQPPNAIEWKILKNCRIKKLINQRKLQSEFFSFSLSLSFANYRLRLENCNLFWYVLIYFSSLINYFLNQKIFTKILLEKKRRYWKIYAEFTNFHV